MIRRLKAYRTANNSVVAEPSVQYFFKKQAVGLYTEDINTCQKDALNGFKIYIERNEKPYNYMTYDNEEEKERRLAYEIELAKKEISKKLMSKQEENLEKILKQQKHARTKESNEIYRDKHKDILDNKS